MTDLHKLRTEVSYAVRKLAPDHGLEAVITEGIGCARHALTSDAVEFTVRRAGGAVVSIGTVPADALRTTEKIIDRVDAELERIAKNSGVS